MSTAVDLLTGNAPAAFLVTVVAPPDSAKGNEDRAVAKET
jgi:hypothetical protein